jgi:hypothetical protein
MGDCSSSACAAAFHILQAHHDLCEHDDLHESVRDDYHDIADVCLAYVCNSATASFDANECHPHEHDDEDHGEDEDHAHDDEFLARGIAAHGRLFLTDAVSSTLHVYDVDTEAWHDEPLPGVPSGATLPKHTSDGRYITLLSRSRDTVRFADSGLNVVDDAHSASVVRGSPHLESLQFSDESPGHVESSFGWLVIFFDGSLYVDTDHPDHKVCPMCRAIFAQPIMAAHLLSSFRPLILPLPPRPKLIMLFKPSSAIAFPESDLGKAFDEIKPVRLFSDYAHHGNAWATHRCRFVCSVYKEDDVLPATFQVQDVDGNVLQTFEDGCPAYHGFAITDGYEMAGCGSADSGGGHIMVLKYRADLDRHVLTRLEYPDGHLRTGTLKTAPALSFAIGNYGDGVLRASPSKGLIDPAVDVMQWPAGAWPLGTALRRPCAWDVQRGGHHHLVAILPDGYMYIYYAEDFAAVPLRIDLFPELRANLTRADYSCSSQLAVRLEVGTRYGFVYRSAVAPSHLVKIDLDEGVRMADVALPASVTGGQIGDMAMVVPALSSQVADRVDCAMTSGPSGPSGVSPSGSGNDSSDGAITALAVTLVVVVIALVVLLVIANRRRSATEMATLTKHVFENPNFGKSEPVYTEAEGGATAARI